MTDMADTWRTPASLSFDPLGRAPIVSRELNATSLDALLPRQFLPVPSAGTSNILPTHDPPIRPLTDLPQPRSSGPARQAPCIRDLSNPSIQAVLGVLANASLCKIARMRAFCPCSTTRQVNSLGTLGHRNPSPTRTVPYLESGSRLVPAVPLRSASWHTCEHSHVRWIHFLIF